MKPKPRCEGKWKSLKTLDLYTESAELLYSGDECSGCGICVSVCPKDAMMLQAVEPEIKERVDEYKEIIRGRDPIRLDADKCALCGVCAAICPRNALKIMFKGEEKQLIVEGGGLPDKIEFRGKIETDPTKCPCSCTICKDICKEGAMDWEEGVKLDEDKCTYCGACALWCPSDAIKIKRSKVICEDTKTNIMKKVKDALLGEVSLDRLNLTLDKKENEGEEGEGEEGGEGEDSGDSRGTNE